MNWIDVVAIVIVALAALRGWRSGAAIQVLTLGGFWLGFVAGVLLAILIGRHLSGVARSVLVLVVIFGCAFLLAGFGEWAGRRLRGSLRRFKLGRADEAVGVAIGIVGSLLAIWLVGNLLATSQIPTVNEAVRQSLVTRTMNDLLPTMPDVFARIESFLSTEGLPVVFVNPPPGLVAPAPLPADQPTTVAAQAARASTVKVVGQACGYIKFGSGFVVQPGLVVTNAHVVAGEAATSISDASGSHRATVVTFDPRLDVALLRVSDLGDPPLSIRSETVARGTTAAIVGYPGGGAFDAKPGAVNARFEAVGLDIYGTALTTREVYELNGVVVPGDSGGPLVATGQSTGTAAIPTGTVIGLVFANSPSDRNVGYALTMNAVATEVAHTGSQPVSTGPCLP